MTRESDHVASHVSLDRLGQQPFDVLFADPNRQMQQARRMAASLVSEVNHATKSLEARILNPALVDLLDAQRVNRF